MWRYSHTFVAILFCSSSWNSSARLYCGLRKLPLSYTVRLPLGRMRASCVWENPRVSFGNVNWLFTAFRPMRQITSPVWRSILVSSFMCRHEMMRLPSSVFSMEFPWT